MSPQRGLQFAFKVPAGAKKLALEDLAVTLATRSR